MTTLVSFGYKHRHPQWNEKTTKVIDVRATLDNPWRRPEMRVLTGLDPMVAHWLATRPNFEAVYAEIKKQVEEYIDADVSRICIGCMGGKHRSAYLVERLGKELALPVEHLELKVKNDYRIGVLLQL